MKKAPGQALKPNPSAEREQRLAEALRANLRRRKGKDTKAGGETGEES